jgi:hypothetical protein
MTRARRLALLAGTFTAVGAAYACTSNGTVTPTPPVNQDGGNPDSGTVTVPDGGDATTTTNPDGGGTGDAGIACESLPGTIIYIESADTQEALLDTVGRELRDKANVTIVFYLTGSCAVTDAIYGTTASPGPQPLKANTPMLYIPSTAENPSWTPAQPENTCVTNAAKAPDFGIAALFPKSCADYATLPQGNITQYIGPTQAYTFIVPTAQYTGQQTSISAEEAYYTFGWGASAGTVGLSPNVWNDPTQFFVRPIGKSTLLSTAFNIKLPPANMVDAPSDGGTTVGTDGRQIVAGSGGLLSAVTAATGGKAIGILGDEVYDSDRGKGVNILAFQDYGQSVAYFPDSTETSFDKQNIRDGHYGLWSPDVYMAPSTSGKPTNATVGYILDVILGNPNPTPPPGAPDGGAPIDAVSITAGVGLTPSCAMQVARSGDGEPLTASTTYATAPCTCKFLSAIPGAADGGLPASCTPCTTTADCTGAGVIGCFNGYCETTPAPLASDGGTSCDNTTIINACTNAQTITKAVTYPDDGGLLASPPQ